MIDVRITEKGIVYLNGKLARSVSEKAESHVRKVAMTDDMVIKIDRPWDSQCRCELRALGTILPEDRKHFPTILHYGTVTLCGHERTFLVQNRIPFRPGRPPQSAKTLVRNLVKKYHLADIDVDGAHLRSGNSYHASYYSSSERSSKKRNWAMHRDGYPVIYDLGL